MLSFSSPRILREILARAHAREWGLAEIGLLGPHLDAPPHFFEGLLPRRLPDLLPVLLGPFRGPLDFFAISFHLLQ